MCACWTIFLPVIIMFLYVFFLLSIFAYCCCWLFVHLWWISFVHTNFGYVFYVIAVKKGEELVLNLPNKFYIIHYMQSGVCLCVWNLCVNKMINVEMMNNMGENKCIQVSYEFGRLEAYIFEITKSSCVHVVSDKAFSISLGCDPICCCCWCWRIVSAIL